MADKQTDLRGLWQMGQAFRCADGTFSLPTRTAEDLAAAVAAYVAPADREAVARYLARRAQQLERPGLLRGQHAPPGAPGPTGPTGGPQEAPRDPVAISYLDLTAAQQHVADATVLLDRHERSLRDDYGDDVDDGTSSDGDPGPSGIADGTGSLSARSVQVRAAGETTDGLVLVGAPIIYNVAYPVHDQYGAFTETMAPDVCRGCLTQRTQFLHDHQGLTLARAPGTLSLTDTPTCLRIAATLDPGSTKAVDLYRAIERGDISQMSIGFVTGADEWNAAGTTRLVTRIDQLIDVSAVGSPASPTTWIAPAGAADDLGRRRMARAEALRELARVTPRRAA